MHEFKVGDIVLVNGDKAARDWMRERDLDPDTYQGVISDVSEFGVIRISHKDGTHMCTGDKSHLTLYKKKRTPPIKRKGYALWIHNIEHKRKR